MFFKVAITADLFHIAILPGEQHFRLVDGTNAMTHTPAKARTATTTPRIAKRFIS
jgi:hypothetical protein